jgi:hypothetical protein
VIRLLAQILPQRDSYKIGVKYFWIKKLIFLDGGKKLNKKPEYLSIFFPEF